MKKRLQETLVRSALTLVVTAFASIAAAQEENPTLPDDLFPEDDLQKELLELFHKVERNLERIDTELNDAGAGVAPLDAVEDAGLDDLLRSAQQRSQNVMQDIDRILQIAEQMGQGQSLGSCMQGQEPGQPSPLDEERDTGPKGRENTPEAPEGEKPEEKGQKPHDGDEPNDSEKDNPPPGENRPGSEQDHPEGPPSADANDAERWGELPARYQETFRNQGADELPVQYRDWIDSYYRRLSRSSPQR